MRALLRIALVSASLSVALVGFAQTRGHAAHGKSKGKPAASADAVDGGAASSDATSASNAANANAASAANNGTTSSGTAATTSQASTGSGGTRPSTTATWPDISDAARRSSPLTPAPEEHLVPAPIGLPPDYDKTIADIALLRARVAAVSDTLFRSRLALSVQLDSDKQKLDKMVVALDDGPVWEAPSGFTAEDPTAVYDHAVAPGRHAITVHIERKDSRDASFSTEQSSRFIVDVPKDQRLEVGVRLEEDSSMGGNFPSDRKGDYDLRVRVKAVAKPGAKPGAQ